MNLVYGLAQVDRAPALYLGGQRFESCRGLRFFSLSHARDMLIIIFIFTKSFEMVNEYVDFNENKHKIRRKSKYYRKYRIENILNSLYQKN